MRSDIKVSILLGLAVFLLAGSSIRAEQTLTPTTVPTGETETHQITVTRIPTATVTHAISPSATRIPTDISRPPTLKPSLNPSTIVATIKAASCPTTVTRLREQSRQLVSSLSSVVSHTSALQEEVNTYYLKTLVPQGKLLPNYTTLTQTISTQKAQVMNQITVVSMDAAAFSCVNGTLDAQITKFRTDMQTALRTAKTYQTTVRQFIQAVMTLSDLVPTISQPVISERPREVRPSVTITVPVTSRPPSPTVTH